MSRNVLGSTPAPQPTNIDPTRELTTRPWQPLTPEQLATFKPQPVALRAETPEEEAHRISYACGVRQIAELVIRIRALETALAELRLKIPA